ncbi:SDR family NAD(P)-dependent oxidoreductase [Nocardia sp. NPDC052566]|uniref:SDR family NAD(P)-dependent oxidoreductase n=1 Tax=Nocardia sp. NPDC052566 TaxID=3364330 RepID=UPI0037CB2EE6
MRDLDKKTAVVVGAGSGIGRATAAALARRGMRIAVGDIDDAAARETAETIAALGCDASSHRIDVGDAEQLRQMVDAVIAAYGAVDVVVNTVGIAPRALPLIDVPRAEFEHVVRVNFWGVVNTSLAFLPHLLTRPCANLVNVVSYAGLIGVPRFGTYAVSKFACRGFLETLQMELHGTAVTVTAVYPGATRTNMFRNSPLLGERQRKALQRNLDRTPALAPDRVAEKIVRGIRRDRLRVRTGPDAVAVDLLTRTLAGGYPRLLATPFERYTGTVLDTGE